MFSPNPNKPVPPEVKRWNWGAFWLTWIWGIFNNTWIAFLGLVPGVHIIVAFILGARGNEMAWQNKEWESVEEFHRVQRKWALAAIAIGVFATGILIVLPFGLMGWTISNELPQIRAMIDDFRTPGRRYCTNAISSMNTHPQARAWLGERINHTGNAQLWHDHRTGVTEVAVPVRGSNGNGTLYLRTTRGASSKDHKLDRAELEVNGQRVLLEPGAVQGDGNQVENGLTSAHNIDFSHAKKTHSVFKQRHPVNADEADSLFQYCLVRIEKNAQVHELLGDNIKTTVQHASIDQYGPMGTAEFKVLLQGNGRAGEMDFNGAKTMGRWVFNGATLEVQTDSGMREIRFPPQQ